MNSRRLNQITIQSAKGLLVRVCGLGLMYVSVVIASNCLGTAQFGVFSSVLSLSAIWAIVMVGGVDVLAVKTISTVSGENPDEIPRQVAVTFAVGGLGTILGIFITAILFLIFFELGMARNSSVFIYSTLLFPVTLVANLRQATTLPLTGVANAIFPEQIILPVTFGLSVIALATYSNHSDTAAVTGLYVLASLAACLLGLYSVWNKARFTGALRQKIALEYILGQLRQARPFFWSNISYMVMNNSVTVLVSFLLGFKEAGLFFVASRLSALSYVPLGVIDQVVMPPAARLYKEDDHSGLFDLARVSTSLGCVAGIAISLGIAIFHKPLLGLFNPEYASQGDILLILLAGQTVNTFFGPNAALMKMTGLERLYSRINGGAAIVLPIAVCLAAVLGGLEWVAICMSVVVAAWNMAFCRCLWLKRKLLVLPYRPIELLGHLKQVPLSISEKLSCPEKS
jgi:O-antigen/teichoic acid export membrane protein